MQEMGPQLYIKDYLNNLNHLEGETEKKLFRMRRRKNNPSRCLNLTQTSGELAISSSSPIRNLTSSTYLNGT